MNYRPIYYVYFSIVVFAIFAYYNIETILQFPAQGAHLWRQADSLAMTWNFKLFNASFFQPETFNLLSDQGKGIAEFPIFYYIAAQFKNPELALRSIHFMFLYFGLMDIFILAHYYLKNLFYALMVSAILACSPFLIFYGTNFIIDVPAFFFAMMAWSVLYTKTRFKYSRFFSLMLFSFAALLKAAHLLNFIILIILFKQEKQLNKKLIIQLIVFISLPIMWYAYAKWFNAAHHNNYLFLSIQPIFKMTFYEIGLAIWRIVVSWSASYFWRPTSVILIFMLIYALIKKQHHQLYKMIFLTFLMSLLFAVLFLEKLIVHEYYYAFFYINVVFVIIGLMYFLQHQLHQTFIRIVLIIFLGINLMYCKNYVYEKQTVQRIDSQLRTTEFQTFLIDNNCTQHSTVFCYDDNSVNQSLYAIKRKGITQYNKDWEAKLKTKQIDFILIKSENYKKIEPFKVSSKQSIYKNYLLVEI